MKKCSKYFILIFFIIFNFCSSIEDNNGYEELIREQQLNQTVFLSIVQGDNEIVVKDLDVIELEKQAFSIRFTTYDSITTLINASVSNNNFDLISDGIKIMTHKYFGMGKGMAGSSDGYTHLIINDNACHALSYNYDIDYEQRVKLIERLPNEKNLVEWNISGVYDFKYEYDFVNNPYDVIYIVLFTNENSNKTIDSGEYYRFEIHF